MLDPINVNLVESLSQRLLRSNFCLSTAESCTGGGLGYCLTSIAGSSDWYVGGYITYSNAAKMRDLAVEAEALKEFGAVSEQVAAQMAEGSLHRTASDLALSITGIAGPDGGSPGKPVGTVCFGWASGSEVHTDTFVFEGDRAQVRMQSIECALTGAIQFLDKILGRG